MHKENFGRDKVERFDGKKLSLQIHRQIHYEDNYSKRHDKTVMEIHENQIPRKCKGVMCSTSNLLQKF